MQRRKIVEILNADKTKLYVEAIVDDTDEKLAAATGMVVKAAATMEDALAPVIALSKTVLKKLNEIEVNRPKEVELTFAIKLSGEVNAWVISGTGEGSIELTMKWK